MFKEILLPVDLQQTELTERAVAIAKDCAKHHGSHITVMTVIPDFGMPLVASYFPDDALAQAEKEVCAELKRFIERRFDDPAAIHAFVDTGSPHRAVVDYAEHHNIDLIIVPARAKDIGKIFLGSSSTAIVEHAPCSVIVVRPDGSK